MDTKLNVGIGRAVITPPLGTILLGYAPGRPAESVGDDLQVTAIAVKSGDISILMLTADICVIDPAIFEDIRARLSAATGVPSDHIIYATTHTHSGPNVAAHNGWGRPRPGLCRDDTHPGIPGRGQAGGRRQAPGLDGRRHNAERCRRQSPPIYGRRENSPGAEPVGPQGYDHDGRLFQRRG